MNGLPSSKNCYYKAKRQIIFWYTITVTNLEGKLQKQINSAPTETYSLCLTLEMKPQYGDAALGATRDDAPHFVGSTGQLVDAFSQPAGPLF